jgi:hypothetical protein
MTQRLLVLLLLAGIAAVGARGADGAPHSAAHGLRGPAPWRAAARKASSARVSWRRRSEPSRPAESMNVEVDMQAFASERQLPKDPEAESCAADSASSGLCSAVEVLAATAAPVPLADAEPAIVAAGASAKLRVGSSMAHADAQQDSVPAGATLSFSLGGVQSLVSWLVPSLEASVRGLTIPDLPFDQGAYRRLMCQRGCSKSCLPP